MCSFSSNHDETLTAADLKNFLTKEQQVSNCLFLAVDNFKQDSVHCSRTWMENRPWVHLIPEQRTILTPSGGGIELGEITFYVFFA